MIVINSVGAAAMNACSHFENVVYKKLGLRPVFKLKQEFFDKTHEFHEEVKDIGGHKITVHVMDCNADETLLEGYPSKEEVNEFIRLRETFCAEEILRKCGWASFVKRCENQKITDVIQRHRPCEDPTHQCDMSCPRFNNCDQAQNVEYLYKEDEEYDYW